jgi:uncharacterized membrane protein SpoIIM required for sporulation
MKELQFVARHQADWELWDRWLGAELGASEKRSGVKRGGEPNAIPASELPHRFRSLCHDLALAEDRNYSSELVDSLQHRVLLAHQRLYSAKRRIGHAILDFFFARFPEAVRRERRIVLAAAALFFVPMAAVMIVVELYPDAVYFLLSQQQIDQFERLYALQPTQGQRGASIDWNMYAYYIGNNVRINFQCFAGGMVFGLGSLFFLLYNGVNIGAVAGHLTHQGLISTFWGFVAGHSSFELLGIVLSGASGLRMGLALIAPGRKSRALALRVAAREAIPLLYGAASMTFLAAFIEAFWSPLVAVAPVVKYCVGLALWALLLTYFSFAGQREPMTSA